jgi:predicted alpha/beta hydrolase family esterase
MVVSGRSSSDANAVYIAETIVNLNLAEDEKLVLVGHSKGAVDILHCLVNFPQAVRHVAAVVSVAGAINGSPMAFKLKTIFTLGWPGISCRVMQYRRRWGA